MQGEQLQPGVGMGPLEGSEGRDQQRGGGGVHGAQSDASYVAAAVAGRCSELVHGVEDGGHVGQQLAAVARDPGAGASAVQQGDAELALQLGEGLAQCGLGDVEVLAGASQRAVSGDGGEVLELLDAHEAAFRREGGERTGGAWCTATRTARTMPNA